MLLSLHLLSHNSGDPDPFGTMDVLDGGGGGRSIKTKLQLNHFGYLSTFIAHYAK